MTESLLEKSEPKVPAFVVPVDVWDFDDVDTPKDKVKVKLCRIADPECESCQ